MRRYLVSPPRLKLRTENGAELDGVTAIVQNGAPFTYFQNRPIDIAEGATLQSGTLAGGVLHRATPLAGASIGFRALSRHARVTGNRQITASRTRATSASRAPTGARCRCRSTATTSARSPRRASRSSPQR